MNAQSLCMVLSGVCLLASLASAQDSRLAANHSSRNQPSRQSASAVIPATGETAPVEESLHLSDGSELHSEPAEFNLSDEAAPTVTDHGMHFHDDWFPSCVSYHPGFPSKPIIERPGDINCKDCLADRYLQPDCHRSGYPHEVSKLAKCAANERYTAWYVGGGTSWLLPNFARNRTPEEGTWGMDYTGILRPRRGFMFWSCPEREQGGLAGYNTDKEPAFVKRLKHE